jgi:1-acyl-sn-glycerol-3-phosphate acyltransferase
MPGRWLRTLIEKGLPAELRERIDRAPVRLNSAGLDEWGLDPEVLKASLAATRWLYTTYFRVETAGIERVPGGRVLIIANHGGQLPLDGMLIMMSLLLEAEPPRVARGMVERWFPTIPFISSLFMRCGQMVGDIHNARDLLEKDQCVLVFPEGTRGSGKPITQRYRLQRFGTGFVRMALETRTPIVPVGIIGCEEMYPAFYDAKPVARLFGAPYIPVTPFFPLLGPLGAVPLPTKVTIRYGEPIRLEGDADAADSEVEAMVDRVRRAMQAEIDEGLRLRGDKLFSGAGR